MTGQDIHEEGMSLFDRALADGIDTGRYAMTVDYTNIDADGDPHSRIIAGPHFGRATRHNDARVAFAQQFIDDSIRHAR
ncbi:MAG: hypothetical protein SV966_10915 [Actinomycetota bacterium]|nr:hypothetical protein [Actinomycetota bacterium]